MTVNGNSGQTTFCCAIEVGGGAPARQQLVLPKTPTKQQSFGSCVAEGGKIFSLQGMLQFITGGYLGNGFLSDSFLGNSVSTGIEFAQNLHSGSVWGAGKTLLPEAVSRTTGPAATTAANAIPNVVVGVTATQITATSTSITAQEFTAALSLKGVAQVSASALNLGLEMIEAPKFLLDVTGAGFAGAICGMMR